jgi:antitoxin VapB
MGTEEHPDELSEALMREIEAILRRVDAMPELDNRSADEILDYDEHGLPG